MRYSVVLSLATLLWSASAAVADDAATIKATPALWVVHAPKATMYLLGSIHVLPKTMTWQTPAITAAMKSADSFVFEAPMAKEDWVAATKTLGTNMVLPIETSLPSMFDNEMRRDYQDVVLEYQIDPKSIVYMRPWLAANALEGQATGTTGMSVDDGVDATVYREAKERGIHDFRAFETTALHAELMLNDGTPGGEMQKLRLTLKQMLKAKPPKFQALLTAWSRADVKTIQALSVDNLSAESKKTMLTDRNTAWIPQIEAMLKQHHTYFMTVGTAHLVGPDGVPSLLRAAGYTVDGPDSAPLQAALR